MTIQILLGGLAAGLVLFVWGFVFWVVLPFPHMYLPNLPHATEVARTLDSAIPESGTYIFPPRQGEAQMKEAYAAGPVGLLAFHKGGVDMEDPTIFLKGFLHFAACAAIAGGIMASVIGSLRSYGSRALFVFRLGLFAGVAIELGKSIWWNHPNDFLFLNCAFHFVGWALAGLVIAAIVKPPAAPAATT